MEEKINTQSFQSNDDTRFLSLRKKPLKEMAHYVSPEEKERGRNMVSIVDNTKPRIMFTVDMCQIIDNSIPYQHLPYNQELEVLEKTATEITPIIPMFYSDNCFEFINGVLYCNNIPFLNCMIEILGLIRAEGQDYYHCRIQLKSKNIFKKIEPSSFLLGKWVFGIAGVVTIGDRALAGKCLNDYLDFLVQNLDVSSELNLYLKPGWQIIDDKFYYITPQGVIGEQFVNSKSECGQNFTNLVPDCNSFRQYLNATNTTTSNVASILVLYTAMSICNFLFRKANFTPKFLLFVHGHRGNFKTSLSLALTQVEYKDTPTFTLKATKAGIESGFRDYKDSVMLVDDLAPAQESSDRRQMQSNLETVVRAFGDGTAHRRCTLQYNTERANKVGQYEAEGGCCITGEYYTGCESSLARCLFVELKKEDVNLELLSSIQDDRNLAERFAVCLISCLTKSMNDSGSDIIGFINKRGKEIRKQYCFKFSNERYGEYISQLQVTSELLMCIAKQFNLLEDSEIAVYSERFATSILEIVDSNNARLVAQNPTTVLCDAIKSAIDDELVLCCALGSAVLDCDNVIFQSDDLLYLSQKCCAKIVNNYIKENDINLSKFTSARVGVVLENSKLISVSMEGATKRYASKLKGYGSKRFMKISKTEFEKHVSI